MKMAAISTIVAAAGAANAGVTFVNTGGTFSGGTGGPSSENIGSDPAFNGSKSIVRIMNRMLTGQTAQLTNANAATFGVSGDVGDTLYFNGNNAVNGAGVITARRIQDFVGSATGVGSQIFLEAGVVNGNQTDQVWHDGTVSYEARARYAGQTQWFGIKNGDGTAAGSTSNGFSAPTTGPTSVEVGAGFVANGSETIEVGANAFRWMRASNQAGSSGKVFSRASNNSTSGIDNMIAFEIFDNIPGQRRYILGFEDTNTGDRDFNDLVIELVVSIPLPTGAAMGMAGLGLLAIRRRAAR
jgi:hypothetical protein